MNFRKFFVATIIFISLIGIVTGLPPNPGHSWADIGDTGILSLPYGPSFQQYIGSAGSWATFKFNSTANSGSASYLTYAPEATNPFTAIGYGTYNGGLRVYSGSAGLVQAQGDLRVMGDNIDSGGSGNLYLDPDYDGAASVVIGKSATDTAGDDLLLPDGRLRVCSNGNCPTFATATGDGELGVEGDLEVDGVLDIEILQARFNCTSSWGNYSCARETGSSTSIGLSYDPAISLYINMVCPVNYIAIAGGGWCNGNTSVRSSRPLVDGVDTTESYSGINDSRTWRFGCGLTGLDIDGGSITCAKIQ